jgi:hypothetical protein
MDYCTFLWLLSLILHLPQAILEYEKNKKETGELQLPSPPLHQATSVEKEVKCCSCLFLFVCTISKIFYPLRKERIIRASTELISASE